MQSKLLKMRNSSTNSNDNVFKNKELIMRLNKSMRNFNPSPKQNPSKTPFTLKKKLSLMSLKPKTSV